MCKYLPLLRCDDLSVFTSVFPIFQEHGIGEGPFRLVKLMDMLDMRHSQLQLSMKMAPDTKLTHCLDEQGNPLVPLKPVTPHPTPPTPRLSLSSAETPTPLHRMDAT